MADTDQQSPPRQLGPAVSCHTILPHSLYFNSLRFSSILNGFKCLCSYLFSLCTAILNEQQAGNCNVAVTSLHRLLLHNVYSPNFGVSYHFCCTAVVPFLTLSVIAIVFGFADPMLQPTFTSEPC